MAAIEAHSARIAKAGMLASGFAIDVLGAET